MSAPAAAPENKAKDMEFSEALGKALLTDEVKNQFILDIDKYTATTKMMQEKFRIVFDKLKAFDDEGLGDKDSTPLHETWDGFHTRYTTLLNDSRDLAGEIANSCNDYLTTIVKPAAKLVNEKEIQDAALAALLKEIGFFLDEGKEMETKAAKNRDAFSKLASEIATFRDNFEHFGEGRKTANQTKIEQIDKDIGTLKGEITKLEQEIKVLGYAMVGTGVGTALLATATVMFPLASLAIFALGVIALISEAGVIIHKQNVIRDKNGEIKQKEKEKAAIEAENARIDAIRTELAKMGKEEIKDILGGLEFFRVLWAQVTADVQSIQTYLEKIQRRTSNVQKPEEYPESVYTFLKTGTTLYYGLSRGLKLYQIGVEKADTIKFGIPPP